MDLEWDLTLSYLDNVVPAQLTQTMQVSPPTQQGTGQEESVRPNGGRGRVNAIDGPQAASTPYARELPTYDEVMQNQNMY